MTRLTLETMTVAELVEHFAKVCIEQGAALFDHKISKFNRLYDQMAAISDELEKRPGDQRRALLALFVHRDIQVRLQAARIAFALAPREARQVIEEIAASRRYPQAGDAGMCLWALDEGIFMPK